MKSEGSRGKPRVAASLQAIGHRDGRSILLPAGVAAGLAFYLASIVNNPLGFFVDESSIAYNAATIARSGVDEHGVAWPLYFRAFGEYKNAPYIYVLAALFKVVGPSVGLARGLSALLGFSACALLGVLASRLSGERWIGAVVAAVGLVTPWLFELSRLVFEVAMYPLALVLFLLAVHRAHGRGWLASDPVWVAGPLALLTYTYTIGRLHGALLAAGLVCFLRRLQWPGLAQVWLLYGLSILPIAFYEWRYPGALTGYFRAVTYLKPGTPPGEMAAKFVSHYLGNLDPLVVLYRGEPLLRHHVPGMGSFLLVPFLLAAAGLVLVLRRHRTDPWWRFVVYGFAVSAIPGSLTEAHFPSFRLIPVPVFLLLLMVPALSALGELPASRASRLALGGGLALVAVQALLFQWQFYRVGPTRTVEFSLGYERILAVAAQRPERPIYLDRNHEYIHAYWYGLLRGMDASSFVRLAPGERAPSGALVLGFPPCSKGRPVAANRYLVLCRSL
jgi:hypothetical protein